MLYRASLVVVYVALRLWILLGGEKFTSYDTASYALRHDPTLDRGPLVSFVGDAPRLWGVPAFYALFQSDSGRVIAQWTFATMSWVLLAFALSGYMRSPLTKFVASAGVLSLSLLPEVASWDLAILSESLSLALGILTLGLFLIWLRSRSRIALISLAPVGCWWTFTRPEIRLFAVALILALLLVLWRRRDGSQKTAAGLVCLFLVAGVVWCTAAAGRVNEVHREYSAAGLSYEDELLVYRLRLHVFADPAIKAVFEERLHMPLCPGAAQVATRSTWDTEDFAREFENCPELAKWGRLNAGRLWPRFLSASPGLYLKLLWQLMNESVAGAHYAQIPAVLPAAAERVWFPSRRVGLPILLTGIVAALLAVWFTRAYRSHRPLVMFGLGLAAIAALDGFVVVSWGAGEYSRFGLLAGIGLRLAWGILLVAALDAAWRSREPGKTPLTISER